MVDEFTGKKFSEFTETKSGMVEPTWEFLNKMKARGIPVRTIRMDPGGENLKLEKRYQSQEWQVLQPIEFEVTSRNTPQHSSRAETGFPYLVGKGKAMMSLANIPQKSRQLVVIEALKCATLLDGLRVIERKEGREGTVH